MFYAWAEPEDIANGHCDLAELPGQPRMTAWVSGRAGSTAR